MSLELQLSNIQNPHGFEEELMLRRALMGPNSTSNLGCNFLSETVENGSPDTMPSASILRDQDPSLSSQCAEQKSGVLILNATVCFLTVQSIRLTSSRMVPSIS
jgi:hypothetical protein